MVKMTVLPPVTVCGVLGLMLPPAPALGVTMYVTGGGIRVNVAVAFLAPSTVTVQVGPVPLHAPDQPVKVLPLSGVADRVTEVPQGNDALHVAPQEMPAGAETTVPLPVPPLVTVMEEVEDEPDWVLKTPDQSVPA
jgi:hypothetical protein